MLSMGQKIDIYKDILRMKSLKLSRYVLATMLQWTVRINYGKSMWTENFQDSWDKLPTNEENHHQVYEDMPANEMCLWKNVSVEMSMEMSMEMSVEKRVLLCQHTMLQWQWTKKSGQTLSLTCAKSKKLNFKERTMTDTKQHNATFTNSGHSVKRTNK